MLSPLLSPTLRLLTLSLLTLLTACGGVPYQPRPSIPIAAGLSAREETIYFGRVFPLEGAQPEPLFIYERRVSEQEGAQISTHLTRNRQSEVVFADSARHTKDYDLIDYKLLGDQRGRTGGIRVSQGEVHFELRDGESIRSAREAHVQGIVVGPTLVGYILQHLPELQKGAVVPIRLAVLERLETIGFQLELVEAPKGTTRVRMRPSSLIIRLAVSPILFTFDTRSSKLLTLEGRVPPKVRDGDRLRDLDARVEYTFAAEKYR